MEFYSKFYVSSIFRVGNPYKTVRCQKIIAADGIVIGAPNYYSALNALTHAMLERWFQFRHQEGICCGGMVPDVNIQPQVMQAARDAGKIPGDRLMTGHDRQAVTMAMQQKMMRMFDRLLDRFKRKQDDNKMQRKYIQPISKPGWIWKLQEKHKR